jgi:spore coat protein A, manganese oxidase
MKSHLAHGPRGSPRRFAPRLELLEDRALPSTLLDPLTQPQFVNPLPIPGVMQPTTLAGTHYEVSISQFEQNLGLIDPDTGNPLLTTVWGYNGSYPGATFEVRQGTPITVHWTNDLVDGAGNPLPHLLPVDTSLHWANPPGWPESGVPVVTHLHGGHSESASDGLPEAWFTPGFQYTGTDWVKETYTYDNDQDATTLWYHDHALGITRLNVYAGLAGFYLIRNDWEDGLNLPSRDYEVPLVIQDRMFTADGQLFYPSEPEVPGAPDPSHLPEFFGDTILVNGEAWPVLDVEPRKYRFRLLNGSDSRVYNLFLSSGQQFYQIGSDGGFLNAPVPLDRLTLAPGERADVIVDFSDPRLAGQTVVLGNNARAPFPKGDTIDPRTVGRIMAFQVTKPLAGPDTSVLPTSLRPAPIALPGPVARTRELLLFEGEDEYGRLRSQLGTAAGGPLLWHDAITENPNLNDVEVWEIYNTTEDTHPIHIHLVQFQVLSRQKFRATQDPETGALSDIHLLGQPKPPDANEAGFKDTVRMNPGEVTRVIMKFDRPGRYVWHCHILSHEDHEMMRPYFVR